MAIYALGDLHLGHSVEKPMNVFGSEWDDHPDRIQKAWKDRIQPEDVVLVPGDISWAMTLQEAAADLNFVGELPGIKVLTRGNHDYWWSGIGKVRDALSPQTYALQNDSISLDGYAICGTRGWMLPSHPKYTEEDTTIFQRELLRLKMALDSAQKHHQPIIAMLHYPPCGPEGEDTEFTALLSSYAVEHCVYGHLHGHAHRFAFQGEKSGVQYHLVSADFLRFEPILITNA